MAKKYIPGETKEQRKARKALEKAQKNVDTVEILPQESVALEVENPLDVYNDARLSTVKDEQSFGKPLDKKAPTPTPSTKVYRPAHKNYVVCLKYGDKYSADYVNKLYNMVKRNLTIDYEFVCFTEDSNGIDDNIRIEPLPSYALSGWWFKPYFFDPNLPLKGTILFLDLDMIIFRNIDNLFTHDPNQFYIIRDFNRYAIKDYSKFNSSVFRINTGQHSEVWRNFITNADSIMKRYHGDQDWIRVCVTQNFNYWPDEWIQSYKWEMRGKPAFDKKPRGKRDFAINGDPIIKDETAIAVFHGDPNPHNCKDKWVIDNWQ